MRYPPYIEADFTFPGFYPVTAAPAHNGIPDLPATVCEETARVAGACGIEPGHRVAVGVGSRGIDRLPEIMGAVCDRLRALGAEPFIVPSMGSHGGATGAGQRAILERLGVTAESCRAPVVSSMAVRQIGRAFGEVPVYFSDDGLKADHAVCVNRVKPHTKFKAEIESGLCKMLCVGMGKHDGALAYHKWALKYGFAELLRAMAETVLQKSNFRFGIAVVENRAERVCRVEAVAAERLVEREAALLAVAKAEFPSLPFAEIDALIIGKIGKEISGSGMDPNVTGRALDLGESDFSEALSAKRVAILNLSPASGGNAIGLGNADFITEKVYAGIDYETTLMNALTSLSLHKAFIPVRMPTDAKAIQACFATVGPVEAAAVRAVIIRDTRRLGQFWVSRALAKAVANHPEMAVGRPFDLEFDAGGDLIIPDLK